MFVPIIHALTNVFFFAFFIGVFTIHIHLKRSVPRPSQVPNIWESFATDPGNRKLSDQESPVGNGTIPHANMKRWKVELVMNLPSR